MPRSDQPDAISVRGMDTSPQIALKKKHACTVQETTLQKIVSKLSHKACANCMGAHSANDPNCPIAIHAKKKKESELLTWADKSKKAGDPTECARFAATVSEIISAVMQAIGHPEIDSTFLANTSTQAIQRNYRVAIPEKFVKDKIDRINKSQNTAHHSKPTTWGSTSQKLADAKDNRTSLLIDVTEDYNEAVFRNATSCPMEDEDHFPELNASLLRPSKTNTSKSPSKSKHE